MKAALVSAIALTAAVSTSALAQTLTPEQLTIIRMNRDTLYSAAVFDLDATVRLYRPRAEILNGKGKFPEPQPVS